MAPAELGAHWRPPHRPAGQREGIGSPKRHPARRFGHSNAGQRDDEAARPMRRTRAAALRRTATRWLITAAIGLAASAALADGPHREAPPQRRDPALAGDPPSRALWQQARELVQRGEALPTSEKARRRRSFEAAAALARRGSRLDPTCAECCLYEFAATAELVTLAPASRSLPTIRRAGALVERCLAKPPSWRRPGATREAADLYYGASAFFRRLPDSLWMRWSAGTRGDPERAVALARRATVLAPERVEYRVELGAALLCLSQRRGAVQGRQEALDLLRAATLGSEVPGKRGAHGARELLEDPGQACSFGPPAPGLF